MSRHRGRKVTLGAIAACAAAALVGAAPSLADPPGIGVSPPDSLTGDTCVTIPQIPLGTTAFGGERYGYKLGGSWVTYVSPPKGFSLASASIAELKAFGFPRPAKGDKIGRSFWRRARNDKVQSGPQTLCLGLAHHNGNRALGDKVGTSAHVSSNWSGIGNTPYSGSFTEAEGDFVVTGYTGTCAAPAYSTSWVGIGGDKTVGGYQHLIQAGTGTNGGSTNYLFYEYLEENPSTGVIVKGAASEVLNKTIGVLPGDEIDALITYSNGTSSFFLTDGVSLWNPGSVSGSAYYDGSTVEWISERPGVGGGLSNLREWKIGSTGPNQSYWVSNPSDGLNDASTTTGTVADATGTRAYSITMNDGHQNVATNAFTVGSTDWYDTWKHCN